MDQINNPICISCLSRSIDNWIMKESSALYETYAEKSCHFFSFLSDSEDDIEFCVKCRTNTMKIICPHCYTNCIAKILESINWIKAAKFRIVFNYELQGYGPCERCEAGASTVITESDETAVLDTCSSCGTAGYFFGSEAVCDGCSSI